MKTLATLLVLLSAAAFAKPVDSQKMCESLYDKAIDNCKVSMCEDWVRDEGKPVTKKNVEECLDNADGDLMEGAQICAVDGGEFDSLVNAYNKKNPKNKINCEDM